MTDRWLADGETAEVFKLDVFEEHAGYYTCEYIEDDCRVQSWLKKDHSNKKIFGCPFEAWDFVQSVIKEQIEYKKRELEALNRKLAKAEIFGINAMLED